MDREQKKQLTLSISVLSANVEEYQIQRKAA